MSPPDLTHCGQIPILILAAGSSSRLGQPKQLLSIQGETLLHRTARHAVESHVGPVVVILGSTAEEIQKTLRTLPVHLLVHPQWNKGMGSTLKAGLQFAMNEFADSPALIISVCDQPYLQARHFRELKSKFEAGIELVASRYHHAFGVPCLFGKRFYPLLMNLADDEGAKTILKKHLSEAVFISFEQGDADIDTQEDWEAVKTR